ncbi:MAG: chorismate synthase [Eubacteriales bacterium]
MHDTFLRNLTLDIYGGSHDERIGVRFGGVPAGEPIDMERLCRFLARRAPGSTKYGTQRRETDEPHFLSGITDGKTDGTLLEAVIYNTNMRSGDYPAVPDVPRPSHADYAAIMKYGAAVDLRGGGHFSGRLTAPLCIAGGIALQMLSRRGIQIAAHIASVGDALDAPFDPLSVGAADFDALAARAFPVLEERAGEAMQAQIEAARAAGDSVGGVIECAVLGLPAGLGEHMFWGMENRIAHVAFGIPGLKGIEFGAGFALAGMRGSEANDPFATDGKHIFTTKNNSGGIQGGMTNGMPLIFRGALKPTPSIAREQDSVSISRMENAKLRIGGRHDPCIAVRAVPVFEAAAAVAVLDAVLDAAAQS